MTPPSSGRRRQLWQRDVADPIGHHVTFRLSQDRVIAGDAAARRRAARILLDHGGRHRLLAFRLADTHAHAIVLCPRVQAGAFARSAAIAIRKALQIGVPFEPARLRPIDDQRHLESAFRYVLRQEQHHGLELDSLHDASSLPDLLGLRAVDRRPLDLLRASLPRVRTATLIGYLGVPWSQEPVFDPALLLDAAAAAFALPRLIGRDDRTVKARHAAVTAARSLMDAASLADVLAVSSRTVQRLRATPCDPVSVAATLGQMKLHVLLGARANQAPAAAWFYPERHPRSGRPDTALP